MRALGFLVVAAFAVGCVPSSSNTTPTPVESTGSPPSETSSDTAAPATPSDTGASASPSETDAPACTTDDLAVSIAEAPGGGAAGSNYLVVRFRNTSSAACSLYGWPGVSLVGDGNGTQLGAAASRVQPEARRVVGIEPGKQTTALLRVTQAGNYGDSCEAATADGFRIYVPNQKSAVYVARKTPACRNKSIKLMEIAPVGTP